MSTGYMGISERDEELWIGDKICIFVGATVPFVVRQLHNRPVQEFIVACYVPV